MKSPSINPAALSFLEGGLDALSASWEAFELRRYPMSVNLSQSAVEYSFKALVAAATGKYERDHDPEANLRRFLEARGSVLPGTVLRRVVDYAGEANMVNFTRQLSEYGLPEQGITPRDVFDHNEAVNHYRKAREVYHLCSHTVRMLTTPRKARLDIGVLNGSIQKQGQSLIQPGTPHTRFQTQDWLKEFERINDLLGGNIVGAVPLSVEEIGDSFDVVVNPFGETYPEEDILTEMTLSRLKRFTLQGGILACAGGIPFWYADIPGGPDRRVVPGGYRDSLLRGERPQEGLAVPFRMGHIFRTFGLLPSGNGPLTRLLPLFHSHNRDYPEPLQGLAEEAIGVIEDGDLAEFRSTIDRYSWNHTRHPLVVGTKQLGGEELNVHIVGATPVGAGQLFVSSLDLGHRTAEAEFRLSAMLAVLHALQIRSSFYSDEESWIDTFGIRQI